MENIVIKVNPNPSYKSMLFGIVQSTDSNIPKGGDGLFINIPLSKIQNADEEIYSGVTVIQFIQEHREAVKVIPVFKFSSLTDQWYFEMSVKEFIKIRNWEMQQLFQAKVMEKYPVGRQLSLMNDKEYALLQLSDLTPFSPAEIIKKILEVVPINMQSSLQAIKTFENNIRNLKNNDIRENFACLQPTNFEVAPIRQWITPILEYWVYYFTVNSIRNTIYAEGKKLELCTTYEAVSLFTIINLAL